MSKPLTLCQKTRLFLCNLLSLLHKACQTSQACACPLIGHSAVPRERLLTSRVVCAQMQMPFHGQSVGMPAQLPSSGDLPGSFPAMGYGHDGSMDSLDCLGDVGLFPPQQSDSMPDYSDLNQAASQMQASPHEFCNQVASGTLPAALAFDTFS